MSMITLQSIEYEQQKQLENKYPNLPNQMVIICRRMTITNNQKEQHTEKNNLCQIVQYIIFSYLSLLMNEAMVFLIYGGYALKCIHSSPFNKTVAEGWR